MRNMITLRKINKFLSGSLIILAMNWSIQASAVEMQRWQTADGVTVTLAERHELPIVNLSVVFKGAGEIGSSKAGVAGFVSDMLALGTRQYDENQFADAANHLGITLASTNDLENATVNLVSLSRSDRLSEAANLMNQMLAEPRFDHKVFTREQQQAIAVYRQKISDPYYVGDKMLTTALYPDHPYRQSAQTDDAALSAVSLDDVRSFYRSHFVKNRAYVNIVGDVNRRQAEQLAHDVLNGLPKTAHTLPEIPKVPTHLGKCTYVPFADKEQVIVMMGVPMGIYRDPDRFALAVGNHILGGGGFDSRLMKKLRDEMGLVYNVSSNRSVLTQAAPFEITLATKKDKVDAAVMAVRQVIAEFLENGPTEKEVQQAKDKIIGGFPLNFDTNAKTLAAVEDVGVLGLPLDYLDTYPNEIRRVTVAQIRETWRRRLNLNEMDTVIVGSHAPSREVCLR